VPQGAAVHPGCITRRPNAPDGDHVVDAVELGVQLAGQRMIISSPIYPSVTIRNWNTTTALLRMMGGD